MKVPCCRIQFIWLRLKEKNYRNRYKISGFYRLGVGGGNWIQRGTQDLIGVIELFCVLMTVVVITVYICQNSLSYTIESRDFTVLNYIPQYNLKRKPWLSKP